MGAAIEVHREYGRGFSEGIYQEAMEIDDAVTKSEPSRQDIVPAPALAQFRSTYPFSEDADSQRLSRRPRAVARQSHTRKRTGRESRPDTDLRPVELNA